MTILRSRMAWWVCLAAPVVILTPTPLPASPPSPDAPGPSAARVEDTPARHTLSLGDAFIVAFFEARCDAFIRNEQAAEARVAARRIVEIRARSQGPDHWQTGDARRLEEDLKDLAVLTPEAAADWSLYAKVTARGAALIRGGKYAEAEPLVRQRLELILRLRGEGHWLTIMATSELASLLDLQKRFAEAEPLHKQTADISRRFLGRDHPATALILSRSAGNLTDQGEHARAEPLYREAREITRRTLGDNTPVAARYDRDLAQCLETQTKFAEAEPLLRGLLEAVRRKSGEPLDAAHAGLMLGFNLYQQRKYAEAESEFRKSLAIRKNVQGVDHADTAMAAGDLALTLTAQGKHAEAEPLLREALDVLGKKQGASHIDTARIHGRLIDCLQAQRKHTEVESLLREALEALRKEHRKPHPALATGCAALAFNLSAQGKRAEAERLFREALDIRRESQGEEHLQTGFAYGDLARCLDDQGKHDEAVRLLQDRIERAVLARGKDHPLVASARTDLAFHFYGRGKYAEAEGLFREVLEVRQRVLGADHPLTATAAMNLGMDLYKLRRYDDAESLTRYVLGILKKAPEVGRRSASTCRRLLTLILRAQGKFAEEEPLLREALAAERATPGESRGLAAACTDLAFNLYDQRKYAEAEGLFREALKVRRRDSGADHPLTATAAMNLGMDLYKLRRYDDAESFFRDALEIRLKTPGEGREKVASSRYWLASTLTALRRFAEAERLYRTNLEVQVAEAGEDDAGSATCYLDLAAVLHEQGKYADAGIQYQRALDIRRRVLGDEHPDVASACSVLASNLHAQGKNAEAGPLYREALKIRRERLGEDHALTARSYGELGSNLAYQFNFIDAAKEERKGIEIRKRLKDRAADPDEEAPTLASLLFAEGRYVDAEPLFRKSVDRAKLVGGDDSSEVPLSVYNLANDISAQGRHVEAEPLYREARTRWRRVRGADHRDTAFGCDKLAANLHDQGKYAEAEGVWAEAARSFEAARRPIGHTGLDRVVFAAERSPWPSLAAVRARLGRATEAWQALEANGSRGLLDDLTRPLTPKERQNERDIRSRFHRLDEQISVLEAASSKDDAAVARPIVTREAIEPLRRLREAVSAEWTAFEARMANKYGVTARPYELARIQEQIPEDAALLAWLDLRPRTSAADPDGEHWACLLRRRGGPTWVRLQGSGPQGRWTDADDRLPSRVRSALVPRLDGSLAPWRELAGRLAEQRLAPLDRHLDARDGLLRATRLIVLPSRAMAGVPVEVLVAARPGDGSRFTVSYAPSGTMFAWLREQKPGRPAGHTPRLLALGDPAFRDAADALRGTRIEVSAIARLFGLTPRDVYLGSSASEPAIDALARTGRLLEFDYLHFATHGEADPVFGMRSLLRLAQVRRTDRELYDDKVTAGQIHRTWALAAEMVTLSACESALGPDGGGEGYLGFSQALFLAGTRRLVLSLWNVRDDATTLLMVRFYKNLLGQRGGVGGRMTKAEALRQAKAWLRELTKEEADKQIKEEADKQIKEEADKQIESLRRLDPGGAPIHLVDKERGLIRVVPPSARRPQTVLASSPPADESQTKPYSHPYYWAGFILIGDPD